MAWWTRWRLFPNKLKIVHSEGHISTQGSSSSLSNGGRTDIWKIRREKFMKNILGLVRNGKVRCKVECPVNVFGYILYNIDRGSQ